MSNFQVSGKIHAIFDTESKSASFTTRDFVLEIQDGNYLQLIKFQLTQDRCDLIDAYSQGDEIEVHFDLRGREWNGKYLTNLHCWKIVGAATREQVPLPPPEMLGETVRAKDPIIDPLPF